MIDNKPYGTECATTVLGIKQLPSWFKGGDWNKAKLEYDKQAEKNRLHLEERRRITAKHWPDFIRLSKAHLKARVNDNDWGTGFIESIKSQAGFYTLTVEGCKFATMEEAEKGWNAAFGSFPYLERDIKGIAGLSDKQINILERIEG